MIVYYRISNNSYNKPKLSNVTKESCLDNALKHFLPFVDEFNIVGDNVTEESLKTYLQELESKHSKINLEFTKLGNAPSFRYVYNLALHHPVDMPIYFLEDDYIHKENSYNILLEGLELGDYTTLYDHPDMYHNTADGGDNPFITENGEPTRVLISKTCHWKISMSTTMTFAAKVGTLMTDIEVWDKHTQGQHPHDFYAFLELKQKGRKLTLPLPAYSSHACIGYLSPFHDWNHELTL